MKLTLNNRSPFCSKLHCICIWTQNNNFMMIYTICQSPQLLIGCIFYRLAAKNARERIKVKIKKLKGKKKKNQEGTCQEKWSFNFLLIEIFSLREVNPGIKKNEKESHQKKVRVKCNVSGIKIRKLKFRQHCFISNEKKNTNIILWFYEVFHLTLLVKVDHK